MMSKTMRSKVKQVIIFAIISVFIGAIGVIYVDEIVDAMNKHQQEKTKANTEVGLLHVDVPEKHVQKDSMKGVVLKIVAPIDIKLAMENIEKIEIASSYGGDLSNTGNSYVEFISMKFKDKEMQAYQEKLLLALIDREWDVVILSLKEFENSEARLLALQSAMDMALLNNAPIDVIVELLNMGAKLSIDTVHLLANMVNVDLLKNLIPYGLNVRSYNRYDMNAIEYLVYKLSSVYYTEEIAGMIELLADLNVNLNEDGGRLDALNYSLVNIESSPSAIFYSNFLLSVGSRINSSHVKQMQDIKDTNHDRYDEIIEIVPRLNVASY